MNRLSDTPTEIPDELYDMCGQARRVVVLTGAGMSAESGVPTFRDPIDGLWENFEPEQLVSVEGWRTDPGTVWAWHLWFAALISKCSPNPGHRALGRWARTWQRREAGTVEVITQNIDDLHERAGLIPISHLHGSITTFLCSQCGAKAQSVLSYPKEPSAHIMPPRCPVCGGYIRPAVTWFGEELPRKDIDAAVEAAMGCDLMLVVGTSGTVHPAAGLPRLAAGRGVPIIEINPRDTALTHDMDIVWRESAAVALPALVDGVLGDHE
ncbi:MAG: NAD-dependent deacylase [Bowdeniella nasicola]|nr:NAD-dependent deacylase [Bowdeniella nasicola]